MQQVCPPLAEIPVGDLACVDDRPEDPGLACGQLAEDLTARGDDRAGAMLARVSDVGRDDVLLVCRCVADQMAAPHPGWNVLVGGVGEVDEHLGSGAGELLPLLGKQTSRHSCTPTARGPPSQWSWRIGSSSPAARRPRSWVARLIFR